MRLFRLIPDAGIWTRARDAAEKDPESVNPLAVPFFVPKDDKEWPSLFALETMEDAEFVAAALRYNEGTILACHFAGVEKSSLEDAGIEVRQTDGATYHPLANERHFEMHIPDLRRLHDAVKLFASGPFFRVEQKQVLKVLQASAAAGQIDLEAITAKDKIHGAVATRTMELVKTKHLTLQASAAA